MIRRASLWDGGEYLLSVSGTSFAERYRRFYYRDIKAIVVQKGPRMGSIGARVLLALLTLFLAAIAATPHTLPISAWFWTGPLAAIGSLLYIDLAQSCRVFIYTTVSSEELPAVFRQSAASRVLPRILDKIREAQGSLAEAYQESNTRSSDADFAPAPQGQQKEWVAAPRQSLGIAVIYFVMILGSAAFAYWYSDAALTPSSLVTAKVLFSALNALGVGAGVWALVRFFRIPLLTGLRASIFAGLGLLAVRAYALYFIFVAIQLQRNTVTDTMAAIRWRHGFGTLDCGLSTIIAITGLIFITFAWQDDRQDSLTRGFLSRP